MRNRWTRLGLLVALFSALMGCGSRIAIELPPAPAVQLRSNTIAVVAVHRECDPFARALLGELGDDTSLRPAPAAELRAVLITCGTHGHDRAWALLAVHDGPAPPAWLLGTAPPSRRGLPWKSDQRRLIQGAAADLAWQLSPAGPVILRRVFPHAPEGSARALYTQAVEAERSGDLDAAYALALQAQAERPSSRAARYLASIERHLAVLEHRRPTPHSPAAPPFP